MSWALLDPPLRGREVLIAPAILVANVLVALVLLLGGSSDTGNGAPGEAPGGRAGAVQDDPGVRTDDFERQDTAASLRGGPVPWIVEAGEWGISAGAAVPVENFGLWMFATYETGVADHTMSATIEQVRDGAGVAVRFVDPINFWAVRTDGNDRWRLTVVVEGEEEIAGEIIADAGDGSEVSLRTEGSVLVLVVDGDEVLRIDDDRLVGATRVGLTATGDDYVSMRFGSATIEADAPVPVVPTSKVLPTTAPPSTGPQDVTPVAPGSGP